MDGWSLRTDFVESEKSFQLNPHAIYSWSLRLLSDTIWTCIKVICVHTARYITLWGQSRTQASVIAYSPTPLMHLHINTWASWSRAITQNCIYYTFACGIFLSSVVHSLVYWFRPRITTTDAIATLESCVNQTLNGHSPLYIFLPCMRTSHLRCSAHAVLYNKI